MNIPCEISKLSTLKAGGKAVLKFTDEALDAVSEHYGNFRDKPLFITLQNKEGDSLRVPCNIVNMESLNRGGKLIIAFDNEVIDAVTKGYKKIRGMPLDMNLEVDTDKFKEILSQISPEQRKKVYVLFKDIANATGDNAESVKLNMKPLFIQNYGYEDFSLSNCSAELAKDFISFLVGWCFMNGVNLTDKPQEILDDIESFLFLCNRSKKCCVCGKEAEVIFISSNEGKPKQISLCPEHRQEWQNIGREFYLKYHVKPIEG